LPDKGTVDILISQGCTVAETVKKLGVSDVTYYRWCYEYGGMKSSLILRWIDYWGTLLFCLTILIVLEMGGFHNLLLSLK